MDAFVIDAFEFCRLRESREGELAVAELSRLAVELAAPSGVISWSLAGSEAGLGHPQLALSVSGPVKLLCQRCLTPFEFGIHSQSILLLAKDEAAADHIENLLEDEAIDVIVGSRQLDIRQLIEDDALLALPLSPRHDSCEEHESVKLAAAGKKPSPFDALKSWKN